MRMTCDRCGAKMRTVRTRQDAFETVRYRRCENCGRTAKTYESTWSVMNLLEELKSRLTR